MSRNDARRQKKLMKKRQKDKLRKKKQTIEFIDPRRRILRARTYPFHQCLINPSWQKDGLANILVSRLQPNGNITFGTYLVDIFCLGLKDTFCNADFTMYKYETELIEKFYWNMNPVDCPIPLAHRIVYGGIEYAEQFGFRPNKDFKLSQYILEDKAEVEPCDAVEFGRDGEPFFIAGPNDNVERIIRQLESKVGSENFDYMVETMP